VYINRYLLTAFSELPQKIDMLSSKNCLHSRHLVGLYFIT
jgi:hypothetical protein